MNEQKHIIWSSDVDYEDWRADMEEQYPDLSEQERMELMVEQNNDYLDDERCNLNIQLSRPILLIADIGRWDGRYPGYAEIKSGNIRDCLYSEMDDSTWYVDRLGDLRCDAVHHDGTNHYLYRAYKENVSETQIDRLKEKLYSGTATRGDVTRVTKRLGDEIGRVYGWRFPSSREAMLRASHLSQRYALEELVLRKYPAEIKELNERIAGYEQDSTHLTEHPKPAEGIAPMVLGVVIYTERENAGKAIIEACTHMNGAETVSIGSYRGFSMLLSYDGAANEFRMVLKGKLPHTAVLGADAGGNVTRIDNALEKITEHLVNARSQLAHTTEQLENARTEMTAPFPKEAELAEKTRRLNELNVLLNLNEQDRPVMADEPDEGDRIRPKAAERER